MDGYIVQVGGLQHQTDHFHGATVSSKNRILVQTTVNQAPRGHAHLANGTTEEDRCSCRGTTITVYVVEP